CLLKPAPCRVQVRAISRFLAASILPVGAVYILGAFGTGVAKPGKFLHWVISHGSGVGLPMWGQLGFAQLIKTAELSVTSIVTRQSVLGLSAYAALLLTAIWGLRCRLRRDGRSAVQVILWLAFS